MTNMFFGSAAAANHAINVQQQKLQAREDTRENAARDARNAFSFTTNGVGSIITGQVTFDCLYIQEPHFSHGVVMVRGVDLTRYHLPLGQAGVYKWIKKAQLPYKTVPDSAQSAYNPLLDTEPDDSQPMYYTGAYLYFEVLVRDRTDVEPDPSRPPDPVLHHHLSFTGIAMKKLSSTIQSSADSPFVLPAASGLALP